MKISARDIDHLSLTLTDPEAAATRLQQLGFNLTPEGVEPRCICFQPDQDDVPNYIELVQGEPVIAVAANVAELDGEERTHAWETEDGYEVDAGVVVGESDGPLPWFAVRERKSAQLQLIFGHWSTLGEAEGFGVYPLDSGCVWGGKLTALQLDGEGGWVSLPCKGARKPDAH